MTTLDKADKNRLKVLRIVGSANFIKKLETMGIIEGSIVEKLFSYRKGPIIVKVKNSQIALGRGMASRIFVKEIE